jgi:hypothetical protein
MIVEIRMSHFLDKQGDLMENNNNAKQRKISSLSQQEREFLMKFRLLSENEKRRIKKEIETSLKIKNRNEEYSRRFTIKVLR